MLASATDSTTDRLVLVMEDDDALRELFSRKLQKHGYHVEQASTVQAARDLLTEHHFSVVLLDIHMGGEKGTDLLSERGEELVAQGTYLVVISSESQYRQACEDMGVHFYLEKPVSLDTLATLVERLTHH